MTRIGNVAIPANSLLLSERDAHYADSYQGRFRPGFTPITAADLGKAFFSAAPAWIGRLFTLRNKLVALFGLKVPPAGNMQQGIAQFKGMEGETAGLFRVFGSREGELLIGENDKHLDFRVSLLLADTALPSPEKILTITTTVYFHNRMGRLYFLSVKPFHRLIVPAMLKAMIRKLSATA